MGASGSRRVYARQQGGPSWSLTFCNKKTPVSFHPLSVRPVSTRPALILIAEVDYTLYMSELI